MAWYHHHMSHTHHYIGTILVGSIISVMVVLNTRLGEATSAGVSFLINQVVGIVILTILMAACGSNRKTTLQAKAPWYYWFGGVFGFLIINANFLTITRLGASLAMATAVFGQSIGSLLFDITGFMGRTTYRISWRKTVTLSVCLLGIIIMALDGGTFAIPYLVVGVLAGVLTMVQMVYNSRFAAYKGILFSARNNVFSGLVFGMLFYALTASRATIAGLRAIPAVPLYLVLGGGLLAVLVVTTTNWIIPKIPAIYSALLLSSAQIITSIILDHFIYGRFSARLLVGALIILFGMVGNVMVDKQEEKAKAGAKTS